jgi:hypothetical protein
MEISHGLSQETINKIQRDLEPELVEMGIDPNRVEVRKLKFNIGSRSNAKMIVDPINDD